MTIDVVTVTDAAKEKGCSRDAIYNAIRRGELSTERIGSRSVVVRDAAYDAWEVAELGGRTHKRYCDDREGSTVGTYRSILKAFERTLAPAFPLYGVEGRHVRAFLGRDLAASTRKNYGDRLRIFFRWCVGEGYVQDDPVPEPGRGRNSRTHTLRAFLSEDDYAKLLRAIDADAVLKPEITGGNRWLSDVVRFTVATGLRRAEVVHLRWTAVDLKAGMVTVANTKEHTTKLGRERAVPLVGDARAVVERLYRERATEADDYVFKSSTGGKLNARYLTKRFKFYVRLAKLPEKIRFHSLRHTFASWFVQRGGDIYRLKEILGHADVKMTMKYAHLVPEALKKEMRRTFGDGYAASDGEDPSETDRLRRLLAERDAEVERLRRRVADLEAEVEAVAA